MQKKIMVVFIILLCSPLATAGPREMRVGSISIGGHGRTLSKICTEIKQKTGYTVYLDKRLADIKVNGSYRSVELEHFFRRVLKHRNFVTEWDNKKKIVYVKGFGKQKIEYAQLNIDNVSGLSVDDLTRKYQVAIEEGKAMYEDQGIDPVSGLPVDELNKQYQLAIQEGKAMYEDQGIDPVSGLSVDELHQQDELAIQEGKAMYEDKGVDPVSGLPHDALNSQYEMAIREGKTMYENQGIDPVSGLPL